MSACLLGQRVRYDGDHRRSPLVAAKLGRIFEWVVVCPEAEAGFGVPRETVRLEGEPARPRMVTTGSRLDRTETMETWCRMRLEAMPADLCGFVFKSGSPSCGARDVPVHGRSPDEPALVASGLFAQAVRRRYLDLPIIDEMDLADRVRAEAFVRSVFERYRAGRP